MSRAAKLLRMSSLYQRCVERLIRLGAKRRRARSEFQLILLESWKKEQCGRVTNPSAETFRYFDNLHKRLSEMRAS